MSAFSLLLGVCGGNKIKLIISACGVVLVVLILMGMLWRISSLKGEVKQLRYEKGCLNATLVTEQAKSANAQTRANLASADKSRLESALKGLEIQLEHVRSNNRRTLQRLARAQEIARKSFAIKPEQTSGVVDNETSNSTISAINSVLPCGMRP